MQRGNAECAVSSERYIPPPLRNPCQKRNESITLGEIKVTRLESIALVSHGELPKPRPNRGAIMLVRTRDPCYGQSQRVRLLLQEPDRSKRTRKGDVEPPRVGRRQMPECGTQMRILDSSLRECPSCYLLQVLKKGGSIVTRPEGLRK